MPKICKCCVNTFLNMSLGKTTLVAESEEELKNLLMRVKEESAKNGLKLNIKNKTKH